MQPRKSNTPGTLPLQSALAPLFLPGSAQKTSKDKSAETNEVVKAEEMAKKTALECEDWTDDDVLIPTIN
ncbi:hypothetical protein VP1G_06680 [Cytospora mali]|uniref:Uncharacterized protein n=1 Tax=Cytospora mali TaxID=578113 RepID=A0A194V6B8_CYTMA|nr:hypothetical protein VP1G_06680 [Valsa mali var. pyri (nom. inval.)]